LLVYPATVGSVLPDHKRQQCNIHLFVSYAFGLHFNSAFWYRAETELKCNTGIKGNHIPWALAYTDSSS